MVSNPVSFHPLMKHPAIWPAVPKKILKAFCRKGCRNFTELSARVIHKKVFTYLRASAEIFSDLQTSAKPKKL